MEKNEEDYIIDKLAGRLRYGFPKEYDGSKDFFVKYPPRYETLEEYLQRHNNKSTTTEIEE